MYGYNKLLQIWKLYDTECFGKPKIAQKIK